MAAKTDNLIADAIPPNGLPHTEDPRLVLANASYFLGRWEQPFDPAVTKRSPFLTHRLSEGENRPLVPLMRCTDYEQYAEVEGMQVLEKSYQGTSLAMTILLPRGGAAEFVALQEKLSAEKLIIWLVGLHSQLVEVHLPRFKIAHVLPLTETLQDMGMRRAFKPAQADGGADFSGMDGLTGEKSLALWNVYHQAIIEVDEKGTTAAWNGDFGARLVLGTPQKSVVFRADHPFLFLIRDTRTGGIVFIGQYVGPDANK